MDEETFLINRERAVDYLNSLDKVRGHPYITVHGPVRSGPALLCLLSGWAPGCCCGNRVADVSNIARLPYSSFAAMQVYVNDQFLNWDPEHRLKVRIISARAYHSLFMHNM